VPHQSGPIDQRPQSQLAGPASKAQVDWRIEAVARRPDVRVSLIAQRAPPEALDDLTQEVLERLIRLGVRPRDAHPRTVIWTICHHVLVIHWRRESARRLVGPEVVESVMARIADPEDGLNRSDAWTQSCCLLSSLPKVPRHAVFMRDMMELPNAEVAARLGISEPAARVAHSRGIAKLTANRRR
jgi:RNA polymerase sigma-70 factor (ECF subfamily)